MMDSKTVLVTDCSYLQDIFINLFSCYNSGDKDLGLTE